MIDHKKCWEELKEAIEPFANNSNVCNSADKLVKALYQGVQSVMKQLEKKHTKFKK